MPEIRLHDRTAYLKDRTMPKEGGKLPLNKLFPKSKQTRKRNRSKLFGMVPLNKLLLKSNSVKDPRMFPNELGSVPFSKLVLELPIVPLN